MKYLLAVLMVVAPFSFSGLAFAATPVGTINVSSSISSSWTITGPANITGSGTFQTNTSKPAGTYTITWAAAAGYITPLTQSFSITNNGDVINFSGTYTPLPDIVTQNLIVSGSLVPNNTLTFSGSVKNQGVGGMDISNSYNFVKVGGVKNDTTLYDLAVKGNTLFVAGDWPNGTPTKNPGDPFAVYDVSNPIAISKAGGVKDVTYTTGLVVSGNYAYVADFRVGTPAYNALRVYDVSGATPVFVKDVSIGVTGAQSVIGYGSYLYVVTGNNLLTFDITVPANPVQSGSIALLAGGGGPYTVHHIARVGAYLYVTEAPGTASEEFQIFDLANPASPQKLGGVQLTQTALGVAVSGNYAYIATKNPGGLLIYDISNKANPTLVSNTTFPSSGAASVSYFGHYVYVGGWGGNPYGNLFVFDVSNPAAPVMVQASSANITEGEISRSMVSGNLLYALHSHPNGAIDVLEAHAFARFCLTNSAYSVTDRDACQNSATNRIGNDFDAGKLAVNGSNPISTTWGATLGTHTVYLCAGGVSESSTTNNCASQTFTVTNTINGACSAPQMHFTCDAGTSANNVTGTNSWTWACNGSGGGVNDSCIEPFPVNGACGSANGTTRTSAPTANLCSYTHTPATVTGAGPWSWTCYGTGFGATDASCTAYKSTEVCGNGVCGVNETLLNCPKDCKMKYQQF